MNNNLLTRLDGLLARFDEVSTLITDPAVIADMKRFVKLNKEYSDLEKIVAKRNDYKRLLDNLDEAKNILDHENDPELRDMAKAEIDDRITGLDAGADDYLTKPFAMGELLARLRSLTRRSTAFTPSKLTVGNVELDVEEQELACRNSIRLANKETKLMKFFMANVGKALSTAQIFDNVWGDEDDVDDSIVFIYVSYLREKLEAVQADVEIVGERGQDYVLTLKEASAEV